jgi:hypothetical protein
MATRSARCHCGALVLECEGEPRKVSICHCLDCQRRTGSVFGVAVFYDRECVTVTRGESRFFARDSASGFPVAFHFCSDCGSNVWWEPARIPGLIAVALGAFADPAFPAPEQAVFTRDKHHWVELPHPMAAFEGNPPPRPSVPAAAEPSAS